MDNIVIEEVTDKKTRLSFIRTSKAAFNKHSSPLDHIDAIVPPDPSISEYLVRLSSPEGPVIGTFCLQQLSRHSDVCLLCYVGIVPEMQGKGYGRQLVDAATNLAHEQGFSQLILHTKPERQRFYEACGFTTHKNLMAMPLFVQAQEMFRSLTDFKPEYNAAMA
jgi:N-acetylglutamate synthase-like GNAT family acetyltransferase